MSRSTIIAIAALAVLAAPAAAAAPAARTQVIGVPRAVAVAERTVQGRTLEAELDYEKGRLVYEVAAVSGSRLHEVLVDATTGEVVADRPMRIAGLWRSWFKADQLSAVRAAPAPLSQLLERVESETGARVREVSLERERGQTYYEVELADAGRNVLIDPRTGAIREGRYDD